MFRAAALLSAFLAGADGALAARSFPERLPPDPRAGNWKLRYQSDDDVMSAIDLQDVESMPPQEIESLLPAFKRKKCEMNRHSRRMEEWWDQNNMRAAGEIMFDLNARRKEPPEKENGESFGDFMARRVRHFREDYFIQRRIAAVRAIRDVSLNHWCGPGSK
ncbi:MAG: hypothetical protein HY059_22150 [Proteobacteria bacterium]|nr:hypothetical protein [Pseudomonadota bacterium]